MERGDIREDPHFPLLSSRVMVTVHPHATHREFGHRLPGGIRRVLGGQHHQAALRQRHAPPTLRTTSCLPALSDHPPSGAKARLPSLPSPRESGFPDSVSLPRATGVGHCSPAVLWACLSPAKETVAPRGAVGSGTQHTVKPMVTLVSPTTATGSHSPAAGVISQLAGCPSAAGPRSPAGETSAGEELSSATGSPWAAPKVKMDPGDPSAGPVLRRANRAQPRPRGVTGAGWDPTPETTSSPTLTLRMLPPDFFTISSSTMDCRQMLSMMACKGEVS